MSPIASQITGKSTVCKVILNENDKASNYWLLVRGIHRSSVNLPSQMASSTESGLRHGVMNEKCLVKINEHEQ